MTARTKWTFGKNVTFKDGWTKTWEGDVWAKDLGPLQIGVYVPYKRGGVYSIVWNLTDRKLGGRIGQARTLTEAKKKGNRFLSTVKRQLPPAGKKLSLQDWKAICKKAGG